MPTYRGNCVVYSAPDCARLPNARGENAAPTDRAWLCQSSCTACRAYCSNQTWHVDLDVVRARQSKLLHQLVHGENERGLTAAGEPPSLAAKAEGQARLELRRLEVPQALATADAELQAVDTLAQCVELAVGREKEVVCGGRLEGDDPDVRVERRIERICTHVRPDVPEHAVRREGVDPGDRRRLLREKTFRTLSGGLAEHSEREGPFRRLDADGLTH